MWRYLRPEFGGSSARRLHVFGRRFCVAMAAALPQNVAIVSFGFETRAGQRLLKAAERSSSVQITDCRILLGRRVEGMVVRHQSGARDPATMQAVMAHPEWPTQMKELLDKAQTPGGMGSIQLIGCAQGTHRAQVCSRMLCHTRNSLEINGERCFNAVHLILADEREVRRIVDDAPAWVSSAWELVAADRTWAYDDIVSVRLALTNWRAVWDVAEGVQAIVDHQRTSLANRFAHSADAEPKDEMG